MNQDNLSTLESLRQQLGEINISLLAIMEQRQSLVQKIMKEKIAKDVALYDIAQELRVFENLKDHLKNSGNRELYIFSMLLENHGRSAYPAYPLWSEGEHLKEPAEKWFCYVNPMMVKTVKPDLFSEIPFNEVWSGKFAALN